MRTRSWLLAALVILCFGLWRCYFYTPEVKNFAAAKRVMADYVVYDHRVTLYCGAEFDADKRVLLDPGFYTSRHRGRAERMEWEHAVPVENYGKNFREWREGNELCKRENGKSYKGRKCAEYASEKFRKMEADMYNLFPSIGAVNASRSNYAYAELPDSAPAFGSCEAKIAPGLFEPPDRAKGQVARAALYMAKQYEKKDGENGGYKLSDQQRQLFTAWNKLYPVDEWECARAKRIERIQKNENIFVKEPCKEAGLW